MPDNSGLLVAVLVSLVLSALVAYPVFKLLSSQGPAKNAVELGRKFLAWTVVMVITNNLTTFWLTFDAIHLIKLAIVAPIFGGIAFLSGWTFWKLRNQKGDRVFMGSIGGQEGKQAKEEAEKRDLEAIEEQAPNSPESAHNLEVNRVSWFRGWVATLSIILVSVGVIVYISGRAPTVKPVASTAPTASVPAMTDTRAVRKTPDAAAATPQPRFDFYTIPPEVAVLERDANGKATRAAPSDDKPGKYLLQAGSFRSFEEADRLKASLVWLGVEASIQTVTVNNKDTWHRVNIGPYKSLADLDAVRARLKENRIETVVLKVKS